MSSRGVLVVSCAVVVVFAAWLLVVLWSVAGGACLGHRRASRQGRLLSLLSLARRALIFNVPLSSSRGLRVEGWGGPIAY